jgi:hypothetical protein
MLIVCKFKLDDKHIVWDFYVILKKLSTDNYLLFKMTCHWTNKDWLTYICLFQLIKYSGKFIQKWLNVLVFVQLLIISNTLVANYNHKRQFTHLSSWETCNGEIFAIYKAFNIILTSASLKQIN